MQGTLKDAIQYASQNPTSDFAVKLATQIKSGMFDTQAKSLGLNLTPIKQSSIGKNPVQEKPVDNSLLGKDNTGPTGENIGSIKDSIGVKVGNALTLSEQAFGQDIAGGASAVLPESVTGIGDIKKAADAHAKDVLDLTKLIEQRKAKGMDTSNLEEGLRGDIQNAPPQWADLYPSLNKTALQILGDAGGTALDVVAAGTLKPAAESFNLVKDVVKGSEAVKNLSTGEKLAQIAKTTAKTSAGGAALGYGYDVTQKAQNNEADLTPGWGTLLGAAIPAGIGGAEFAGTLLKAQAPRVVNSLIKPLAKDFSYGKDPGRTISSLGITGNNWDDFINNIRQARQKIGSNLSQTTQSLEGKATLKLDEALNPIDDAINEAATQNNQTLLNRLTNVKTALTHELGAGIDETGNTVIQKNSARNLDNASFSEGVAFKRMIGDMTQWTGNASDDKVVNAALKKSYGAVKNEILTKADSVDPAVGKQVRDLSEKYADLSSAEIAAKYRDKIVERQNLVSLPVKFGTAGALITAVATGGAAIPAILGGVGAAVLEKALASPAVKTRIAAWLGKEAPEVAAKIISENPSIGTVLKNAFTKEYTPIENVLKDIPNKQGGFVAIPQALKQDANDTYQIIKNLTSKDFTGKNGKINMDAFGDIENFIEKFKKGTVTKQDITKAQEAHYLVKGNKD